MKVGRDNDQPISRFRAGLGCYPPVIFFHPVPGWVPFLQTYLISELCVAPCPQSGSTSNCCFPSSDSAGHWKSQHSPSPDKAPGFQLCNPVWVGQGAFSQQHRSQPCPAESKDSDDCAEEGHSQACGAGEWLDMKSCWSTAEGGLVGVTSEHETVIIFALGSTSYTMYKSLCLNKGMARETWTENSQETQSKVPILFVWKSNCFGKKQKHTEGRQGRLKTHFLLNFLSFPWWYLRRREQVHVCSTERVQKYAFFFPHSGNQSGCQSSLGLLDK